MSSSLRLAAVYGALLAVVALAVNTSRSVVNLDAAVHRWLMTYSGETDLRLARLETGLFGPATIIVATFVLAAVIAWRKSRLTALVVIGTVGFAGVMDFAIKAMLPSERPLANTLPSLHAFPSGHVATVVALGGIVALIFERVSVRLIGLFVTAIAATVTAQSRLLPGIHWLTDIIGGVMLGCMAVMLGLAVLRRAHVE